MLTSSQKQDIRNKIKYAIEIVNDKRTEIEEEDFNLNQVTFIDLLHPNDNTTPNSSIQKFALIENVFSNVSRIGVIVAPLLNNPTVNYIDLRDQVQIALEYELKKIDDL